MCCCAQFRSSLLSNLWGKRGSQAGQVTCCLQLSIWECKSQLKPVLCLHFHHGHLPHLSGECFLYMVASVTLLCPLAHLEGIDSVPAMSRTLCQVAPSLCTPRPRDYSVSCSLPYEAAVPHRFSPGVPSSLWTLFWCVQDMLSQFACKLMGNWVSLSLQPGAGPEEGWGAGRLLQCFHKWLLSGSPTWVGTRTTPSFWFSRSMLFISDKCCTGLGAHFESHWFLPSGAGENSFQVPVT